MLRIMMAFAALCLFAAPAAAQFTTQPPKMTDGGKAYQQLLQDVKEARDLLQRVTDAKTRRRLENLLSSMELQARRMAEAGGGAWDPGFPLPQPMAKEDFAKLLKSLQDRKNQNKDRLQLLVLADGQFFTCEQGKAIVQSFMFGGDGQRNAAIWLYGRLVDRQNFNTVLEGIRLPLEREAVLRALGLKVQ